jgi:hypothetical protein
MKNSIKVLLVFAIVLGLTLFALSCRKTNPTIGRKVLPTTERSLVDIVSINDAPMSPKVKEMVLLGAAIHQKSFSDIIGKYEAIRGEISVKTKSHDTETIDLILEDLRTFRSVVTGKLVMINRSNGYLVVPGLQSVEFLEDGLREYGLILPDSGWEPGPTLGAKKLGYDAWIETKANRISSGKWAGAYRYQKNQIVLPGLKCFPLDLKK